MRKPNQPPKVIVWRQIGRKGHKGHNPVNEAQSQPTLCDLLESLLKIGLFWYAGSTTGLL